MNDLTLFIIGAFVVCTLPFILFAAFAFFGMKWATKTVGQAIIPDRDQLNKKLAALRTKYPNLSDDQLVSKIINQQSLKAGLVGAMTGLGGLITLPIAIPIDLTLSAKIQAALIYFITTIYKPDMNKFYLQTQTYAIMAGHNTQASLIQVADRALQTAIQRFVIVQLAEQIAKAALKFMPVIGALAGFLVNWAATQSVGRIAKQWHTGELQKTPGSIKQAFKHVAHAFRNRAGNIIRYLMAKIGSLFKAIGNIFAWPYKKIRGRSRANKP